MRFPIDALFLDRDLRVLEIVERLRPWRFASKHEARAVLELSAGECARRGLEVGDMLELRDRKPVHVDARAAEPADRGCADDPVHHSSKSGAPGVEAPKQQKPRPLQVRMHGRSAPKPAGGELARLQPLCVLVVSPDRRFRTVMSLLLARRNCSVTTIASSARVGELVERESVDVVVVDASQLSEAATDTAVATVEELARPVGVVLVADDPTESDQTASTGASGPPVAAKWGPFEQLFETIELVDQRRGSWKGADVRG